MRFPHFDFYPGDWQSDTSNAALTFEEQGVHMKLLCLMWDQDDCTLPDDDPLIARWLKVTPRKWKQWRAVLVDGNFAVFRAENGKIFSKKLRKIFQKAVADSKKRPWFQRRRAWMAVQRKIRPVVLARDGFRCQYCGSAKDLEIDHIVPIARGGWNNMSNLQVLCRPCNRKKWAHMEERA